MHEYVTKSGVFGQQGYNFAHRYSVTSKCTKVNAVMSTKSTDDTEADDC